MDIILLPIFLFILGTIIGSFLNVVILRYEPGRPFMGAQLFGHSHCPKCGRALQWYELIPVVSYLIQLGRCRGCGKPISFQYPTVEILGGIIVASFPFFGLATLPSVLWISAILILLTVSFIDLRHLVIPDGANILLLIIGVALTVIDYLGISGSFSVIKGSFLGGYAYIFSFTENVLIAHIAAAILLGAIFSLIIILTKGKAMGWGDAKLAAIIGLMLGWPDAILALMIAFIVGAAAGISLMATGVKKMKDALPFGPFISVGVVTVIFFGYEIMSAYFKFLNLLA
ncbi:MAG: prepilin peptidase [Candidatus Colwellbacteria bacterium]|nr:prepilin peptidase [Candidatus Colwellbacteria bacterium]